ncbi:MAG: NAD-dependent epimerase/dehydratase family protein [Candidatus Hydrogenedentes bacterium]|nr:NAD-dependent epimerase/dehydratase family protein [Candidatus Hydrogenedentota bacterium]
MARILVTGGAGFIGSHVAEEYIALGHEVVIVDNLSSGKKENIPEGATFIEIDICSDEVEEVFRELRPDYLAHLAAQIDVRKSVADPVFDAKVNILGGINLLQYSVKYSVKKFIFASTGGAIYGEAEVLPVPETYHPKPLSPYGTSKLGFEHYIGLYQRLYNLNYLVLRLPNVYGPRQSAEGEAGVCSILAGLMLRGKKPILYGYGEPMRDYVYVKDIARAFCLGLEKGVNEIVNLGSAVGTKVREIFDIIAELTGYRGEPELAPLRPGEIHSIYITGDKAKEILGWAPQVLLRDGLKYTVEYVRNNLNYCK